jgi:hypothetical protein
LAEDTAWIRRYSLASLERLSTMRCSASLRIFSESGLAADVTERLGIEPTSVVERGERPRLTAKKAASASVWRLATTERASDLAEHLVELLDQVEPTLGRVLALAGEGYVMDWWCSVESLDTERAIELAPTRLGRLAAFPGPLLIDAWTTDEE